MIRHLFLTCLLLLTASAHANDGVAKAIIVRGKALAQSPDGKVIPVDQGMWLQEGTQIRTEEKSFVKLLFVDKSQMNLGPSSQMKIDKFPKNDPGIVTLVKGQLRSKVSKNYMEMDRKDKSKLFIKTKTAAMGVRGTDFQVNYNPENNFTSLVTFEGAVAMASLDVLDGRSPASLNDQGNLERIVSSRTAVTVTRGQFSGASPETGSSGTIPVKINPIQLETMEKDVSGTDEAPVAETSKKPARSIVPPGVSGAAFSNKPKVEAQVAKTAGASVLSKATKAAHHITHGFAPSTKVNTAANGAVVNVATGQLVIPPKNAPIDPNTGVPMMNGVSTILGGGGKVKMEAAADVGVVVTLQAADKVAKQEVAASKPGDRAPASTTTANNPLLNSSPATTAVDPDLIDQGGTLLKDNQDDIIEDQDLGGGSTATRVNFNFNVE